jgi:hypothetical protein
MDYSGAEDHEQQGDFRDARVRQVRRRLGGPRLGKQHQREHRRVRGDRDRQRLRPHPDRGEDERTTNVTSPAAAGPPPSRPAISRSVPYLLVVVTPSAFSMTSSSSGRNDRTTDSTAIGPYSRG